MPSTTLAMTSAYRKGREKNILRRSLTVALVSFLFITLVCLYISSFWNPYFPYFP